MRWLRLLPVFLFACRGLSVPSSALAECRDISGYAHFAGARTVFNNLNGYQYHDGEYTAARVLAIGDVVYAVLPGRMFTVDFTDPTRPAICDSADVYGYQAELVGDRLYLSAGWKLDVFDVSTPRHPVRIGSLEPGGWYKWVTVSGTTAYVSRTWIGNLEVYDLGDAAAPELLGEISLPNGRPFFGHIGQYGYQADTDGTVRVMDLSDPLAPAVVDSFTIQVAPWLMDVDGDLAVLAGGSAASLFDVSDPVHPRELSRLDPTPATHAVKLRDGVLATGDGRALALWDVSDPTRPVKVHELTQTTEFLVGTLGPTRAYTLDAASEVGAFEFRGLPPAPSTGVPAVADGKTDFGAVRGGYGYALIRGSASREPTWFEIYDVRDPTAPDLVARLPMQVWRPAPDSADWLTLYDDMAVVTFQGECYWVNIENPANPFIVAAYQETLLPYYGFKIDGGTAYVPDNGEVQVLDFSYPPNPVKIASLPGGNPGLAQDGLLIVDSYGRFQVYDIIDPHAPRFLTEVPSNYPAVNLLRGDLLIRGYAFISSVDIFDLSDPARPVLRSRVGVHGRVTDLALRGDELYVAEQFHGVDVFDISDPDRPQWVGVYGEPSIESVLVCGDRLYLSVYDRPGSMVVPLPCASVSAVQDPAPQAVPTPAASLQPNPFNPATTVRFAVAHAGAVRVGVYDLRGRLVARLADEVMAAGEHQVTWPGRDARGRAVPSGTYLVTVETPDGRQALKASLLK